jgi:hypothetical protein
MQTRTRKRYDPNEIILKEEYAELVLYNRDQTERCRALIDKEQVDLVSQYRWSLTEYGYVRGRKSPSDKEIFLHRLVLDTPPNKFTDHINMNRLDNRLSNLRICNKAQNSINRNTPTNNTAGYKGVSLDKRRNLYRAYIKVDGRQIWLGYHESFKSAKLARIQAEQKYFGEFARTNDVGDPDSYQT